MNQARAKKNQKPCQSDVAQGCAFKNLQCAQSSSLSAVLLFREAAEKVPYVSEKHTEYISMT